MDIKDVTSIEAGIEFFNEHIAGDIHTADGKILHTHPIVQK